MKKPSSNILLGSYIPGDSILHRADPRAKLISAALILYSVFATIHPLVGVIASVTVLGAVAISRVPISIWHTIIRKFSLMFSLVFLLNALFHGSGRVLYVYGYEAPFTMEGVLLGLELTGRVFLGALISLALVFTTKPVELARALEGTAAPLKKIGVPVQDIATIFFLALRFIPVFQLEMRAIIEAQKARGISFDEHGFAGRAKMYIPILGPSISAAIRRSEAVATAMSVRGYKPGRPRTYLNRFKFAKSDYIISCWAVALFIMTVLM